MVRTRGKRLKPIRDSRTRQTGITTSVILAVTVALALVLSLGHPSGVTSTLVLLLVGGGTLATLYLTWVMYRDSRRDAHVTSLSEVADQLARAIGEQWEAEARLRRLNDPYPLNVSWSAANPALTDSWALLVRLARTGAGWPEPPPAGTWASDPEELADEGEALARIIVRIPTRRLVVLGEPGTGKTMLMVRLVLDLLKSRQSGGAVPFLAPLASWNPLEQDLQAWLVTQLIIGHPALDISNSENGISYARALLAAGLIIPILDGLDEIPQSVRGTAITGINDAMRPGEAVVVTCRLKDYREIVRPPDAPEVTLRAAAAVQLNPLNAEIVADYLLSDAGGPEAVRRWEPVIKALRGDTPVAKALSTPLMTGLARAIYNPRPGELGGTLRNPSELLSAPMSNRGEIEAHLFDAFISAAYRSAKRWSMNRVYMALAFLASYLEGGIKTTDLAWWELRYAVFSMYESKSSKLADYSSWFVFILLSILVFLPQDPSVGLAIAVGLGDGVLCSSAAVFSVFVSTGDKLPSPQVRLISNPRLRLPVTFGLILMLVLVLVINFVAGTRAALASGLALGTVLAIIIGSALQGVDSDLSSVPSPRAALDSDRRASFVIAVGVFFATALAALSFDLFLSIITGLKVVHSYSARVSFPITVGIALGFAWSANETAWPTYVLTRIWLRFRRMLPWDLIDFLEDAHRRGVLRQVGAVYQFRHIELQHQVATHYRQLQQRGRERPIELPIGAAEEAFDPSPFFR
jgi:hypothetical protein